MKTTNLFHIINVSNFRERDDVFCSKYIFCSSTFDYPYEDPMCRCVIGIISLSIFWHCFGIWTFEMIYRDVKYINNWERGRT